MKRIASFVGLDVHKDSITIAKQGSLEAKAATVARIPNDSSKLLSLLRRIGQPETLHCCYEAGPTGYGLHRLLESKGIRCSVVAPTMIPQMAGERVKTDSRDSMKLARYLRNGDLTEVWVPDPQTEALRDLVRARAAGKADERAARHRLTKFLLRHDHRYPGRTAWTGMHLEWIRVQKFEHEAQNHVLREYLHVVEDTAQRIERLDADILDLAPSSSLGPLIEALQALKGIRLLTATTIAVELGCLRRFPSPRHLMSFIGLVPSEHSSGESRRRGGLTKSGNKRLRCALVESAWAYRHAPKKHHPLRKRTAELPPHICRISWTAQHRLHRRYLALRARLKKHQVVIAAVARELAGFVWAIGQEVHLKPQPR